MDADRTIAPSPARLLRARRAGLRPGSRWLVVGLTALALAAVLDGSPGDALASVSVAEIHATLASSGAGAGELLLALAHAALGWAALAVLLVFGVTFAVTVVTGNLGPIDAARGQGLGIGRLRVGGVPLLVVAVLAAGVALGQLVPVIAGATRAVDASADGLLALWHGWFVHVAGVVGSVLVLAGMLELWLARRQQTLALYQSVEQAREDMRRHGSRRA